MPPTIVIVVVTICSVSIRASILSVGKVTTSALTSSLGLKRPRILKLWKSHWIVFEKEKKGLEKFGIQPEPIRLLMEAD